jgi:hypothetical protein
VRDGVRYSVGNWVEVTRRREGGPDVVLRGKVVEATPDLVVVSCRTSEGEHRVYWRGDDTPHIWLRRLTGRDFARRRRGR